MIVKEKCQIFKLGISHLGNKANKKCKSIAMHELNGKKMCVNCYTNALGGSSK